MLLATNILINYSLTFLLSTGTVHIGPVARQDTVSQGIEGVVYRASGNHMPAPGHPSGTPAGIPSTVYIFALTNISQVTHEGSSSYYSRIHTRLIKQVGTDSNGYFRVSLPPGTYSLFTKKGDLFFASRRDDKNNIAPVEVLPGKITRTECRVESDHRPVY